jgi:hypothetical protein
LSHHQPTLEVTYIHLTTHKHAHAHAHTYTHIYTLCCCAKCAYPKNVCVHLLYRGQLEELTLKSSATTELKILFEEPWILQTSHARLRGDVPIDRDAGSLCVLAGGCGSVCVCVCVQGRLSHLYHWLPITINAMSCMIHGHIVKGYAVVFLANCLG